MKHKAWLSLPLAVVMSLLGGPALVRADQADRAVKEDGAKRMLLGPQELRQKLTDGSLRLLDIRPADAYAAAHIPGAVRVDLDDWKRLSLSDGGLHDADAWAERVGRLGIDQNTRVVVYGDPITETARVWWLLKYLGVKEVALLDGGWQVWVKSGGPQAAGTSQVTPRKFQPRFQADRLEEIDALKRSLGREDVTLVDTRSAAEFTGRDARGPRGGHIPGSVHLEWKDLLAADGRFKSPEELRRLFDARGIEPGCTAVTY